MWSDESMAAALKAVKEGESILRAAKTHGVPRSTLQDRVKGRVVHGTKPGPRPYLDSKEEGELCNFLVDVSEVGYGKTKKEVKLLVENVAREKGVLKKDKVTDGWYRRFAERQPKLSLRKGDATAHVRMDATTPETMKKYFDLLHECLTEHNLIDSPGQIYNVDETGMSFEHKAPRVLTKKGKRKVRYRTSGNKSQVTVIGCVSAAGHAIPPFVIFDAKRLNLQWAEGEVPGTTYGLSSNGWVDSELFRGWLVDHFVKHATGARPLFLLLDGHSSHYQPELVRYARDNGVILFCLPPHTTHESQPLDASVFGPLKQHWSEACHDYIATHPGRVLTKYQFSPLLSTAWTATMTPQNITSGFRRCGIYPFNRDAIKCNEIGTLSKVSEEDINRSDPNDDCPSENESNPSTSHAVPETSWHDPASFTVEQEALYQTRFEEGYDLHDPDYTRWLQYYHPEIECPVGDHGEELSGSILDHFDHVSPAEPISSSNATAPSSQTTVTAT